jgi:rod shape determining protein RodA
MAGLMVIGILAVRTTELSAGQATGHTIRQIIYSGVAWVAFVVAAMIPYQRIGRWAYAILGVTLGLLVLVLVLRPIRGSHRWIDLGFIQFQPAEAAKLAYVLFLAWYLRYGDHYRRLRGLMLPLLWTLVPMALILKEPDLGTSLLFLPTLYVMLYVAGAKRQHLISMVALGAMILFCPVPWRAPEAPSQPPVPATGLVAESEYRQALARYDRDRDEYAREIESRQAMAYGGFEVAGTQYLVQALPLLIMESHQLDRVEGWLRQGDPEVAREMGYQLKQSKVILGAGGVTGWGDWLEKHAFYRLLPDDQTDFIFAVIGGKWGLVGCVTVLVLYLVIFIFGLEIALSTYEPFGRLLVIGVLTLIMFQAFINVGMTTGLMPITGMTLPLVSYGGSSLMVTGAALGLVVNVARHRPIMMGRRPFEHDDTGTPGAGIGVGGRER